MLLPRRAPGFVGRQALLAELRRARELTGLVLIEGPPGIGKTALALELAHEVERPIWLRVRPDEGLLGLLHRLGPHLSGLDRQVIDLEGCLEDRLAPLVAALEAQRCCLFLDGLEALPEMAGLLGSVATYLSLSTVVATTSRRAPLTAAERAQIVVVEPGPLAREEALALLEQLLGVGDWESAVDLAAGHPLALKLLAGRLRQGRSATAAALIEQCLEGLPQAWFALLRRLALATTPVPVDRLPGIAELADRFLVEVEDGEVRLSAFLAEPLRLALKAPSEQHLELVELWGDDPRVLPHLLALGRGDEARQILQRHRTGLYQEGRFQELLAATEATRDPDLMITRADALTSLGRLSEALEWLARVGPECPPGQRLKALNSRAHTLLDLGRLEEAAAVAEQALELAGQLPDRQPGAVKALNAQARVLNLRSQGQAGQLRAEQAMELANCLEDRKGLAYAGFIRAQSLVQQGRYADALGQAESSQALATAVGETRLTFLCRFLVGACHLGQGRTAEAAQILERAWSDSRSFPDLKLTTMAELMQARHLLAAGRTEQARLHLRRSGEMSRRLGNPILEIQILLLEAEFDPEALQQARALAQRVGAWHLEADCARRQDRQAPRPYRLVTADGESRLSAGEYAAFRERRGDFGLWIDLAAGEVWERSLGEVSVLGKKVASRVLVALLEARGQTLTVEELFARTWDHAWEGESSAAQVRKHISGLRNLVEPDRAQPRYLLAREHAFGVRGGYALGNAARWCLLQLEG